MSGVDINAVRWGIWHVERSAVSVLVFNKEKEKRTKKEKEITPSKKVAVCRPPRVFKRKKEKAEPFSMCRFFAVHEKKEKKEPKKRKKSKLLVNYNLSVESTSKQ